MESNLSNLDPSADYCTTPSSNFSVPTHINLLYQIEGGYDHKRRRRGAGGLQPLKLGRNPFHSGKFSERTIGNSGNSSALSPALFDISGRKFTAPQIWRPLTPMVMIRRGLAFCLKCINWRGLLIVGGSMFNIQNGEASISKLLQLVLNLSK